MKRDWDVIRKLMLEIEALPAGSALTSGDIGGVDTDTAFYHMRLLLESGLAANGASEMLGGSHCHLSRLTWAGHEFLDHIRNDSVWSKVKQEAKQRGLDLTFGLVQEMAKGVLRGML